MEFSLREIIEACGKLNIAEKRNTTDDYFEVVFEAEELESWHKTLSDNLGPAVKPEGQKPSREDQLLTEEYGGIFKNQTLFRQDFEEGAIIAMLWPWQDGINITLKVILITGNIRPAVKDGKQGADTFLSGILRKITGKDI